MLVLSRRVDEKIVLPNLKITVQVVAIRPGVVRLGIEAPPDVAIVREELRTRPHEARVSRGLPRPNVVVCHGS